MARPLAAGVVGGAAGRVPSAVAVAAAEVGADPSSAYRYLQLGPSQELAVTVLRTRVRVAGRESAESESGWGPLAENRSGLPTTPTTKR